MNPKARRVGCGVLAAAALATVVAILALEGLAGAWRAARTFARWAPLAEQFHTEYDPELGWISRAGFQGPDFYGPGRHLHTNAQRFRNPAPIEAAVPPGRVRVACSGDSFTLGYGVADDAAWCARLEALDPRFQAVNLGQGGYGIDQSWLWARRGLREVAVDVHLLAFVCDDFDRMATASLYGYGKPLLALRDGVPAATNLPVPRSMPLDPWLSRLARALGELHVARLWADLRGTAEEGRDGPAAGRDEVLAVARAVFRDLDRWNRERGGRLVLVRLPTMEEGPEGCPWWKDLAPTAREEGWPVLDLPASGWPGADLARRLFLADGEVPFRGSGGHYNEQGNDTVARMVLAGLRGLPFLAGRPGGGGTGEAPAAPAGGSVR